MPTPLRTILHLDLDAFFCAVEELRDPNLRGKPFAVGGSPEGRGVVASCSYAARKYGIHSAMPMARALRLCPDLLIVRHHFRDYTDLSGKVMDMLSTYSDLVQPISIDEAFIDISHLPEPGVVYARQLQQQIRDFLHLPSSLGVASNKLVAKVATNVGKANHGKSGAYPYAIQVVPHGEEAAFLAPLPSDALWGIGPKTAERLAALGMRTVGDIARYPLHEMVRLLGQTGSALHFRAQGIDDSPVHVSHETKSVSHEETFARDINNEAELLLALSQQAQSIGRQLRKLKLHCSTVAIKLRWPDFSKISRQLTLPEPTDDVRQIEQAAHKLFRAHWKAGRKVRLIGLRASNLTPPSFQPKLWDWNPKEFEKQEKLDVALQTLKARFGEDSLMPASGLPTARAGRKDKPKP